MDRPSRRTTTLRLLPAVLYAVAVVLFIKDRFSLFDFPLDDAWIHRVYSQALAFGRGMAYNAGVQEAGSTSPLWSVVSAPAHWLEPLGVKVVAAAVKAIGLLLGLISVYAVHGITHRITGSLAAGILAACLFALEPRLHFSSLSGMENTLLLALWLGALVALLHRRPLVFALLSGLMATTRPEAAVLLPIAVFCLFLDRDTRNRPGVWMSGLILMGLPLALWFVYCQIATGHWLPNTYYVKAKPFTLDPVRLRAGWDVLTEHGFATLPLFVPAVAAAFLFLISRRLRAWLSPLLILFLAPLAYLVAVAGTRSLTTDAFYWTRWVDPSSLVFTATACLGLALLASWATTVMRPAARPAGAGRWLGGLVGLVLLAGVVLSSPAFVASFQERRTRLASDSHAIHYVNVEPGIWINKNTPPDAVLGVNDAGALRYFGKRHTIDFMGLNNHEIVFDRLRREEALHQVDWLAIFPSWFQRMGLVSQIQDGFEARIQMGVTEEKYTVCDCPGQTRKWILERKRKE